MDWERIADEVELRTSSLFNDTFRRRFDDVPSLPSLSSPTERIWNMEEKELATRKRNEKLEEEISSLKVVGSQQRERISSLEQTVAELAVELKALKAHSLSTSSLYQKLNSSMFTLNDAVASTSNDVIVQSKHSKALDVRLAALEADHCSSVDLEDIDRALKKLDVQIQENSGKSDSAALRSYQAAFFSDTLLQSLENLYKSPTGDEKAEAVSQAVTDMTFLLKNALLSVANSATFSEDKIASLVDAKLTKELSLSKEETEKARKIESVRVDGLDQRYTELPSLIRKNLIDDQEFVQSIASQVPQIAEQPVFRSNVEEIVFPLLKTTNSKVQIMQEEAQSRVQNQMNSLQDVVTKLNDRIQLLDREMKSEATVIHHVSTPSAPIEKTSNSSSDDAVSSELQFEVYRLIDVHREQMQSGLSSLEDRLTSISLDVNLHSSEYSTLVEMVRSVQQEISERKKTPIPSVDSLFTLHQGEVLDKKIVNGLDSLRQCLDVLQAEITDISEKMSHSMTVPLTSSPALSASSVTQPQESIASNVALPPSLSPISGKTSPRNSVLGPIQSPKLKSGASNLPPDGFPREKESRKAPRAGGLQATCIKVFVLGEKVEGRYMGGNRWFPAKIMNVNRDGTYDLRYDDGDEEAHVAPSFLRNFDSIYLTSKKESPTFSKHEKYVIDDPVEARYLGGGKWFPGKICSVNKDETYDVHYNDGEVESSLTSDLIRRIVQSALLEKASPPNSIHSKIVAHVHPVLVPLTQSNQHSIKPINERTSPETDSGSREQHHDEVSSDAASIKLVLPEKVKKLQMDRRHREDEAIRVNSVTSPVANSVTYKIDDKIECRFMKGSKWFKGKIATVNESGTYTVVYDDGDKELEVDVSFIRKFPPNAENHSFGKFKIGQQVDARFLGEDKWFPAVIESYHGDETYDVNIEQSGTEAGVPEAFIRERQEVARKDAVDDNSLLTPSEQFFYDIDDDNDGSVSHADLDEVMNDVNRQECQRLIDILKLPSTISGPELRALFDNMNTVNIRYVKMAEFAEYVESSDFKASVVEICLRHENSSISTTSPGKKSPKMPSGPRPISPRIKQETTVAEASVESKISNQEGSPDNHATGMQGSTTAAFSESADEFLSSNGSDDGAFSDTDSEGDYMKGLSDHLVRKHAINSQGGRTNEPESGPSPFDEPEGILNLSDSGGISGQSSPSNNRAEDNSRRDERSSPRGRNSLPTTPRPPGSNSNRRREGGASTRKIDEEVMAGDDVDDRIMEGSGRENIWDRIELSSGRKKKKPGNIDGNDSAPTSPLSGLAIDHARTDSTIDRDSSPQSSSPVTKELVDVAPSPSSVLTHVLSTVTKQSSDIAAALASEDEFHSEPVLSGMLRRKGPSAAARESRSNASDKLPSYPFSSSFTGSGPASSIALSQIEATNRAIHAATGNREPLSETSDLVANFNRVEAQGALPAKDSTTQCNFCLKRIKMAEMPHHHRSCPVRKEPCQHCGTKISVVRMDVHVANECPSALARPSREEEVYTPYSTSIGGSIDDDDDDEEEKGGDDFSIILSDTEEGKHIL